MVAAVRGCQDHLMVPMYFGTKVKDSEPVRSFVHKQAFLAEVRA